MAPIRVPSADSFRLRQDLPACVSATIVTALAGVTVIAWIYTWLQVRAMTGIEDMAMPTEFGPWTTSDVALNVAIWWIMMIGMMLPSAMPMVLVFAAANRSRRARGGDFVPTAVFAAGYLIAWAMFGLAATFAEWFLEQATLISPATQRVGPTLGAGIVIAAGLYQLTPLKNACLVRCRSPLDFVLNHWREGAAGAVRMGLEHGFLLPRLLLGSDGSAVCRRCHEPAVDGGTYRLRPDRKIGPGGSVDRARQRTTAARFWGLSSDDLTTFARGY